MISSKLPAVCTVFGDKADIPIRFAETLPDYLPDIRRIVGADCRTLRCSASAENDRVRVIASGAVELVFVAEGKGHVKTAVFPFTLDKAFALSEPLGDEPYRISAHGAVLGIGAAVSAPRTVEFRGNAEIAVRVTRDTLTELDAFDHDGVCLHETTLSPVIRHTYTSQFDRREDIALDADMPAIAELGQTRFSFINASCRKEGGVIVCSADLQMKTVYRAETDSDDGDDDYIYVTKSVPVSAELSADSNDEDFSDGTILLPRFELTQGDASVSFDSYGENRVIRLTLAGSAFVESIRSVQVRCFDDAFCPGHTFELTRGTHAYETLAAHYDTELHTISGFGADAARLAVIHDASLRLCAGELESSEGKPVLCEKAVLTVDGSDSEGMPVSLSNVQNLRIPFPMPEPPSPSDRALIVAEVKQCDASLRAGQIAADITLAVRCAVLTECKAVTVDDIRVGDTQTDKAHAFEYVFCYPGETKRIWDIAKQYDVSPEDVCRANGIKQENVEAGHLLMIPCMP